MTREAYIAALMRITDWKGMYALLEHDKEQRAEIARLKNDLSHWTFVRFQQLESENKRLREALKNIYAIVMGECPALLHEDSGGDAALCVEIENLLKETP